MPIFVLVLLVLLVALLSLLLRERRQRRDLAESQQLMESVFDTSAMAMVLMDRNGRCLRVNRAFCEMIGYPEAELLARRLLDLTYPDDRASAEEPLARLLAGEIRGYQLRTRLVHRSGQAFWAQLSHSLLRDVRGEPRYGVAQIDGVGDPLPRTLEFERGIAGRDRELHACDLLIRRIANHVPASIAYFDRSLSCQWLNPEAQARLGLGLVAAGRLEAAELPLFGAIADRLEAALASGATRREEAVPVTLLADGQKVETFWDFVLVPSHDAEDPFEGLLVFAREVTDRIERERQREQQIASLSLADALKDQVLDTLTHEIRSPLTVILGTALLFQGEALGPLSEKQHRYVTKVLRNGRELLRIVTNTLAHNRLHAERIELFPDVLSMADLIAEVLAEIGDDVAQKGMTLDVDMAQALPPTRADRRRVAHVWLNLLSNALQHAPEGATITLRARPEGESLYCEVFNTGSQLPPEILSGEWGPEYPSSHRKGMGLGLLVSRAMIEAHGGRFGVANQDGGVSAWFTLPVAGPPEAPGV